MKTKIVLAAIVALGSVICSSSMFANAFDDCLNAYTNRTAQCDTARQTRDDAAYAIYNPAFDAAESNYNTTLINDMITDTNAEHNCDLTLWGKIGDPTVEGDTGSCGATYSSHTNSIQTNYESDLGTCTNTYTDPTALAKCVCEKTAIRDYFLRSTEDGYWDCKQTAQNEHDNKCITDAKNVQTRDDLNALSLFWQQAGDAEATLQQSLKSSSWAWIQCDVYAYYSYANCTLRADCAANPPNCCQDNCSILYNGYVQGANTAYNSKVGPAEAQEVHDIVICNYTQTKDDYASYAAQGYILNQSTAKYNHDQMADYIDYVGAVNENNSDAQNTIDNCNCDELDPSVCVSNAMAIANAKNATATSNYLAKVNGPNDNPVGSNWSMWYQTTTNANEELQREYQQHAAAKTACVNSKQQTFQAILDSASTAYNTAMAAAEDKYESCLERSCWGG